MSEALPKNWATKKLDELGFVGRGKSRHRPRNDESLYGGNYPFVQTGDVKAAEFYLHEFSQTYNDKGLAQSKLWNPDTLCITIAANIADTAILKIKACFPDSVVGFIADPQKADVRFVKHYIDTIKLRMQNISKGTTQDNLSLDKLMTFDFAVPPLETQRKIATILSTYDGLIENNTRRIKVLEEMAQTIYREWFVNFRFPGHEKVNMVDSPLGKIPEGLEVQSVGDLLCKVPRRTKIQKKDYLTSGEIPVIDQGREFIGGYTDDEEALIEDHLPRIVFGDHTRILKYVDFPFACGADGTQLLMSNTPKMPPTLFYYALLEIDLSNFGYARHFKFLKAEDLVVPDQQTASLYQKYIGSMRDQISCLNAKNLNLRQTRDLLLPKLISGEIDVSELKIETKETAA